MWPVLLLLLWLSPVTSKQKTGSCSQPQSLCCLGTDHRCRRGSCYCDEFCHVIPDCCPDYHSLCNPASSQTTKMVLQMVLSVKSPPGPPRSNPDWVKNMVHQLLHTSLVGRPLSMAVKGMKKRA